jgi:hypothetical protein
MLRQLIRQLEMALLVQSHGEETWSLGPLGHEAVVKGAYPQRVQERRSFYFVENDTLDRGPHFLNLTSPRAMSLWPHTDGWRFPLESLSACFQQSEEWKRQNGFPLEVRKMLPAADSWEKVILDRSEHLFAVLILVPRNNGVGLLGFAVQPEGWILFHKEPAFALQKDWQVPFPQLGVPVSLDLWRHAWREWCQLRGLPSAEVDASALQLLGCRIRITAPVRLVERLRAERSDVYKGQAWLLAGTGQLRAAAQMELHPQARPEERGFRSA